MMTRLRVRVVTLLSCRSTSTAQKVQVAVTQLFANYTIGGGITVVGFREIPGQSSGEADLQFNSWQYKMRGFGQVVPKDTKPGGGCVSLRRHRQCLYLFRPRRCIIDALRRWQMGSYRR